MAAPKATQAAAAILAVAPQAILEVAPQAIQEEHRLLLAGCLSLAPQAIQEEHRLLLAGAEAAKHGDALWERTQGN